MATRNDITGDSLTSKPASEAYRNNYDAIFGKKKVKEEQNDTDEPNQERPDPSSQESRD